MTTIYRYQLKKGMKLRSFRFGKFHSSEKRGRKVSVVPPLFSFFLFSPTFTPPYSLFFYLCLFSLIRSVLQTRNKIDPTGQGDTSGIRFDPLSGGDPSINFVNIYVSSIVTVRFWVCFSISWLLNLTVTGQRNPLRLLLSHRGSGGLRKHLTEYKPMSPGRREEKPPE